MSYIKLPEKTINDLNSPADINQLMDNIEALKGGVDNEAPVSNIASLSTAIIAVGDGIIESGSNTNGRYIKFRDGTMICIQMYVPFTMLAGSNFHIRLYPSGFIARPSCTYEVSQVTTHWDFKMSGGYGYNTQYDVLISNNSVQQTGYISYTAVGRWKA